MKLCVIPMLFMLALLSTPSISVAQVSSNLPIIQNVGVIPVQWSDESRAESEFYELKKLVEDEYPKAVRSSRKYRVANEQLVANQWRNVTQREALVKSQELDGFFVVLGTV